MASAGKKKRKTRQKKVERYMKDREDLQLSGRIVTAPEGAIRDERVDPSTQDEQKFPGLDRLAIRNDGRGWAVPEHVKRRVIEKAAEVLFEQKTMVDADGKIKPLPPDRNAETQASRTLMLADQMQFKVDNPEAAGKAAGATEVNVVTNVVDLGELLKRAKEQREIQHDQIDVKPPEQIQQQPATEQPGAADTPG